MYCAALKLFYLGGPVIPIISWNPLTFVVFIIFGCTQLIPLKKERLPVNAARSSSEKSVFYIPSVFFHKNDNISYNNNLQCETFPIRNGVFMLTFRFMYFALLATGVATIWR
jgi:hypothetical protein